jgi:hypothetical protein
MYLKLIPRAGRQDPGGQPDAAHQAAAVDQPYVEREVHVCGRRAVRGASSGHRLRR